MFQLGMLLVQQEQPQKVLRLLIKEHNVTGLKYLCKTECKNWQSYTGSGKYWKRHLKKHGKNFSTTLLFETCSAAEFRKVSLEYSQKFDVVNSPEWANFRPEEGDGGSTTRNTRWITNGTEEKIWPKGDLLPEGWKFGRHNCAFSNTELQTSLSNRTRTWREGKFNRDHTKCGTRGEAHPMKRSYVKDKVRQFQLKRAEQFITCTHCGKVGKDSVGMRSFHFGKCKKRS
jgi:hypothetical protein